MNDGQPPVREIGASGVDSLVDVLCEAFFDYPVMRFVLGDSDHYERRLRTLVTYFVMARVLRDEALLGVGGPEELDAGALVSRPHGPPSPSELGGLRTAVWAELGTAESERYEAFSAACAAFEVAAPHIHLNMIGVRDRARGQGLGRRVIEHVHAMSLTDPASEGVSLTTEVEENISLYQHFGYEIVGEASVDGELTTWSFYRPDPSHQ